MTNLNDTPKQIPEEVVHLEALLAEAICLFFVPLRPDIPKHWLRFLFEPWVHFFLHGTYDRWQRAQKAGEYVENFHSHQDIVQTPGDTASYMELNRTIEYKYFLDQFFRGYTMSLNCEKNMQQLNFKFFGFTKVLGFKTGLPRLSQYVLQCLSLGRFRVVNHRSNFVTLNINTNLRSKFKSHINDYISNKISNQYNWIGDLVVLFFPTSLMEYLLFEIKNNSGLIKIKKLISCNAWMLHDDWKIHSVFQKIYNNTILIGMPHALNHMLSRFYWERDFEIKYLDKYYFWGQVKFKSKFDNKIKRGQVPHWAGLKNKSIKPAGNSKILITSAARPTHLLEYPYTPEDFNLYLNNQIDLAEKIQIISKADVVVRTRPKDLGWNLKERYLNLNNKNIEISFQKEKFISILNTCDLHICDNISTTIAESLNSRFPTLILLENNYFQLTGAGSAAMQKLKEVGVFHENPDSLLKHLEAIIEKIDAWWYQENLQAAINDFLQNFASTEKKLTIWHKLIKN